MNIILFDDAQRGIFLPLSFTRPVAEFRIGILTIREKWERYLNNSVSFLTEDYLQQKYPLKQAEDNLYINGRVCPDPELLRAVTALRPGEVLKVGTLHVAARTTGNILPLSDTLAEVVYATPVFSINSLSDIFSKNAQAIADDYLLLTAGRKSAAISKTNQVIMPENVFIEEGAKVECSILNASTGHIYIGKDAEVMEGSIIRGPFALGDHAQVKMGAKIYGPTTVGPESRVGGEVNNSVIFGYSNKGHDGFLGNSVLGEWCNIGADSNNSNLKNNYAEVKLWNYTTNNFKKTGLQFCGLIMGDHSKCGINTMFNTGTVIGVSCNIFGSGFPRNFVPDFSWGGAHGYEVFTPAKAFEVAERVFERRNKVFDTIEKDILSKVFELTESYRK